MTTETSLEFVEAITFPEDSCVTITLEAADYRRLLKLANPAALIDRYKLEPRWNDERQAWFVSPSYRTDPSVWDKDLHTAVRAVADKIKAGNHG